MTATASGAMAQIALLHPVAQVAVVIMGGLALCIFVFILMAKL